MCEIIDADEDIRIPEMRQIMIAADLDFRRLLLSPLFNTFLPFVFNAREIDPGPWPNLIYEFSNKARQAFPA
jgi:hypothetical protein